MTELTNRLRKPGVFDTTDDSQRRRELWAKGFELAKMHADVFGQGAGSTLLDHWITMFLTSPVVRPNEDAFAQGIREGKADFVRQLLRELETARLGGPQ